MRGKHAASAAARRVRAESEAVAERDAEIRRLREALAEAVRPERTPQEDALAEHLTQALTERDAARVEIGTLRAGNEHLRSQLHDIAGSLAATLKYETTGASAEAWSVLAELNYDTGPSNRSLRRISKGGNAGAMQESMQKNKRGIPITP